MTEKIKYVKHPVSAEEKKKLRGQGYKILDERFDPDRKEAKTKQETEIELNLENLPKILKGLKNKDEVVAFAKDNYELEPDESMTRKEMEAAIADKALEVELESGAE